MSFIMTVTAQGQFTLNKQGLSNLGIRPGEKVSVSEEPDRTIRIAPATRKLSLDEVLARIGKYDVGSASVDEINRLIAKGCGESGKEAVE